jgi:hypothetical protein
MVINDEKSSFLIMNMRYTIVTGRIIMDKTVNDAVKSELLQKYNLRAADIT